MADPPKNIPSITYSRVSKAGYWFVHDRTVVTWPEIAALAVFDTVGGAITV